MTSERVYEMVDELDELEQNLLKICKELKALVNEFKGELE